MGLPVVPEVNERMGKSFFKAKLEICLYDVAANLVNITVGKTVGGIIADHRLPLSLCQDLKLHCEPRDPSSSYPIMGAHSRVDIQLAFILDVSQCCCLLSLNKRLRDFSL